MSQFFGRTFKISIAVIALLYALAVFSYVGSAGIFVLVSIIVAVSLLAYRRIDLAILAVFLELFCNSHGALIFADIGGFFLTLRMSVFIGVMIGWLFGIARKRYRISWKGSGALAFGLLPFAIVCGLTVGLITNPFVDTFSDGNAYFFLLYLFPILSVESNSKYKNDLLQILSAGAIWTVILSFGLLYSYTHFSEVVLENVYLFLRDVRVAEITSLGDGIYRVFLQSQVFTIIFGILLLAFACAVNTTKKSFRFIALGALPISVIILALSRSFWVGLLPTILTVVILLWIKFKPNVFDVFRFSGFIMASSVLSIAMIFIVVLFPIPYQDLSGTSLANKFRDRTTEGSDAGVSSRWKLLDPMLEGISLNPIFGKGFGATVTFQTDDPRIRAINAQGTWTTYSMEWGWIELWLKMGILGPIAFLWAGFCLVKRLIIYLRGEHAWLGIGLISSLVFIFATHFFSPYLNHPIGLGYLLLLILFLPKQKTVIETVAQSKSTVVQARQIPALTSQF